MNGVTDNTIDLNMYKNHELEALGVHLNQVLEDPNDDNYMSMEEKINYYLDSSLYYLLGEFNSSYINYNVLQKFNNKYFLELCRHNEEINKKTPIISFETMEFDFEPVETEIVCMVYFYSIKQVYKMAFDLDIDTDVAIDGEEISMFFDIENRHQPRPTCFDDSIKTNKQIDDKFISYCIEFTGSI